MFAVFYARCRPKSIWNGYRQLRNLAIVALLFSTGMRVGEASSLNVEDFAAQEGVFAIEGKGGRRRLAFAVDQNTLQIQKDHLEARMKLEADGPALFLNASRRRLSTQGVTKMIAKALQDEI